MPTKSIKTIAGLQRAWNACHRRSARLYARPYILRPALERHQARLDEVQRIEDAASRFQAFRLVPALEYELQTIHAGLSQSERESLAQRDRATRPRVRLTKDGQTMEMIVLGLVMQSDPSRRKAKEFWSPLFTRLRELGLNPKFMTDLTCPAHERIEYQCGGKRRSLTLAQFGNIVSKVRRRLAELH